MQEGDITIDELAESQNVKPMVDVRALFGTWPDGKNDGFEEAINELRHWNMIKEVNYDNDGILTDRISDTGERKLKHFKKIVGEGGYYLLEFVEEDKKNMKIKDFTHKITVDLLSQDCLKRPCYTPQLSYHDDEVEHVCGRRILHGCPVKYIKEEETRTRTKIKK